MDSLTLQRILPKTFVATRISVLLIVKTIHLYMKQLSVSIA